MNPSIRARPRFGFTIIEIVVTIGVIAVLMGLLVPALGVMRARARQTVELSAARQLMVAWTNYAVNNDEAVLPGYLPGLDAFDEYGRHLADAVPGAAGPVMAGRYPWRLAPFLGWEMDGLYVNDNADTLEALRTTDYENYVYQVATFPSFGLNTIWVGGDAGWGLSDEAGGNLWIDTFGRFWATRTTEIRRPAELIVFASARGASPDAPNPAETREGYFKVESPVVTEVQGMRWADQFRDGMPAGDYGHLSLRHGDAAVIGFADGRAGLLNQIELRDMRHWSPRADRADWGLVPLDDG